MATASVRINQDLVDRAAIIAKALDRTTPKQIEHWALGKDWGNDGR